MIHVQDPHASIGAQEAMARGLAKWSEELGIRDLYVEGGWGDCSLEPVRRSEGEAFWASRSRGLLQQGWLAGEEYLALTGRHPLRITGIEDPALYRRSVALFARMRERRNAVLSFLAKAEAVAGSALVRAVDADTRIVLDELDRASDPLTRWTVVRPHLEAAGVRPKRRSLLARLERIRAGRSYSALALPERWFAPRAGRLLAEIDALERRALESLLTDERARTAWRIRRYIRLLRQASRLQLTPDDAALLRRETRAMPQVSWQAWLNQQLKETGVAERLWAEDALEPFVADALWFYRLTQRRDRAFARNFLANPDPSSMAVLITGGHHTDLLVKQLNRAGVSVVVFAPVVEFEGDADQYEQRLLDPRRSHLRKFSAALDPAFARAAGIRSFRPAVRMADRPRTGRRRSELQTIERTLTAWRSMRHAPGQLLDGSHLLQELAALLGMVVGSGLDATVEKDAVEMLELAALARNELLAIENIVDAELAGARSEDRNWVLRVVTAPGYREALPRALVLAETIRKRADAWDPGAFTGEAVMLRSRIQDAAGRLVALLKSRSRLQRPQHVDETYPLGDVIAEAYRASHGVPPSWDLDPERACIVRGDRLQMVAALANLMTNALQEAARSGDKRPIMISLDRSQQGRAPAYRVRIQNYGRIPRTLLRRDRDAERDGLERQMLFRLNVSRRKGGTGLGTTEAFYAVRDAGGTLRVRQTLLSGEPMVSMVVQLPAARMAGPAGRWREWNLRHPLDRVRDLIRAVDIVIVGIGGVSAFQLTQLFQSYVRTGDAGVFSGEPLWAGADGVLAGVAIVLAVGYGFKHYWQGKPMTGYIASALVVTGILMKAPVRFWMRGLARFLTLKFRLGRVAAYGARWLAGGWAGEKVARHSVWLADRIRGEAQSLDHLKKGVLPDYLGSFVWTPFFWSGVFALGGAALCLVHAFLSPLSVWIHGSLVLMGVSALLDHLHLRDYGYGAKYHALARSRLERLLDLPLPEDVRDEVARILRETPNHHSLYHHEGRRLWDHLVAIDQSLLQASQDPGLPRVRGMTPELFELVRAASMDPEDRRVLEWVLLSHDLGKRKTARRKLNGDWAFRGHGEVSAATVAVWTRRNLLDAPTGRTVEFIVRHHMKPIHLMESDAGRTEAAWRTEIERMRGEWSGDDASFERAIRLLTAFSTLDLLGSWGPNRRPSSAEPARRLFEASRMSDAETVRSDARPVKNVSGWRAVRKATGKLPSRRVIYPSSGMDAKTLVEVITVYPEVNEIVLVDPGYRAGIIRTQLLAGLEKKGFGSDPNDRLHWVDASITDRGPFRVYLSRMGIRKARTLGLTIFHQDFLAWRPEENGYTDGFGLSIVKRPGGDAFLTRGDDGERFYAKVMSGMAEGGWMTVADADAPGKKQVLSAGVQAIDADHVTGMRLYQKTPARMAEPADTALIALARDAGVVAGHFTEERIRAVTKADWSMIRHYYGIGGVRARRGDNEAWLAAVRSDGVELSLSSLANISRVVRSLKDVMAPREAIAAKRGIPVISSAKFTAAWGTLSPEERVILDKTFGVTDHRSPSRSLLENINHSLRASGSKPLSKAKRDWALKIAMDKIAQYAMTGTDLKSRRLRRDWSNAMHSQPGRKALAAKLGYQDPATIPAERWDLLTAEEEKLLKLWFQWDGKARTRAEIVEGSGQALLPGNVKRKVDALIDRMQRYRNGWEWLAATVGTEVGQVKARWSDLTSDQQRVLRYTHGINVKKLASDREIGAMIKAAGGLGEPVAGKKVKIAYLRSRGYELLAGQKVILRRRKSGAARMADADFKPFVPSPVRIEGELRPLLSSGPWILYDSNELLEHTDLEALEREMSGIGMVNRQGEILGIGPRDPVEIDEKQVLERSAYLRTRLIRAREDDRRFVIAVDDHGFVAGYTDQGMALSDPDIGQLFVIEVRRDIKGGGLGRTLLEEVIRHEVARGAREMSWHASREGFGFYVSYLAEKWPFTFRGDRFRVHLAPVAADPAAFWSGHPDRLRAQREYRERAARILQDHPGPVEDIPQLTFTGAPMVRLSEQTVTITGSEGHIGSILFERLADEAVEVRRTVGEPLLPDREAQERMIRGSDAIFHLAGRSSAVAGDGEKELASEELLTSALLDNALSTAVFVRLAEEANVFPRIVFASSIQVYDLIDWKRLDRPVRESDLRLDDVTEAWVRLVSDHLLMMASDSRSRDASLEAIRAFLQKNPPPAKHQDRWYALSKITAERVLAGYRNGISLRLAGVYGPGLDIANEAVLEDRPIERWIERALAGQNLTYPPASPKNYIYVEDAAGAIAAAAAVRPASGASAVRPPAVINVGAATTFLTGQIGGAIKHRIRVSDHRVREDADEPGGTPRPLMDTTLLRSELGIEPRAFKPMGSGIQRYLDWRRTGGGFEGTWAGRFPWMSWRVLTPGSFPGGEIYARDGHLRLRRDSVRDEHLRRGIDFISSEERRGKIMLFGGAVRDGLWKVPVNDLDLAILDDKDVSRWEADGSLRHARDQKHPFFTELLPWAQSVIEPSVFAGLMEGPDFTLNRIALRFDPKDDADSDPIVDEMAPGALVDLKQRVARLTTTQASNQELAFTFIRQVQKMTVYDLKPDPVTLRTWDRMLRDLADDESPGINPYRIPAFASAVRIMISYLKRRIPEYTAQMPFADEALRLIASPRMTRSEDAVEPASASAKSLHFSIVAEPKSPGGDQFASRMAQVAGVEDLRAVLLEAASDPLILRAPAGRRIAVQSGGTAAYVRPERAVSGVRLVAESRPFRRMMIVKRAGASDRRMHRSIRAEDPPAPAIERGRSLGQIITAADAVLRDHRDAAARIVERLDLDARLSPGAQGDTLKRRLDILLRHHEWITQARQWRIEYSASLELTERIARLTVADARYQPILSALRPASGDPSGAASRWEPDALTVAVVGTDHPLARKAHERDHLAIGADGKGIAYLLFSAGAPAAPSDEDLLGDLVSASLAARVLGIQSDTTASVWSGRTVDLFRTLLGRAAVPERLLKMRRGLTGRAFRSFRSVLVLRAVRWSDRAVHEALISRQTTGRSA